MKITFCDDDGIVIDQIDVVDGPCPDIENLDDDNLYLDAPDMILDACHDVVRRYAKRRGV